MDPVATALAGEDLGREVDERLRLSLRSGEHRPADVVEAVLRCVLESDQAPEVPGGLLAARRDRGAEGRSPARWS